MAVRLGKREQKQVEATVNRPTILVTRGSQSFPTLPMGHTVSTGVRLVWLVLMENSGVPGILEHIPC